jgi:rubrerythrin
MLDNPTIRKAVQFAVATENVGAQTYTELAEKFSDRKELSEAFSLLAADERGHGAQFRALLDKLPTQDHAPADDEQAQYLRAMASSEFFTGEDGLAAVLEKIGSVDEALRHVLGFEKASLGFYQALRDVLGPQEALDAIIAAEKQHVVRVMKYLLTDEKMKGLADKW